MIPLLLLLGTALAVDAHGPLPPAADGDPARPLRVTSGPALNGGAVAVVGEYAHQPLNLFFDDGSGPVQAFAQLDHIGLANLQIAQGFGRLGLSLVLPAAPFVDGEAGTGPAIADPELAGRVAVLDGRRGGLSLVPAVRFPLGSQARYLGAGGFSASGRVAGTVLAGGFTGSVDLGIEGRPVVANEGLELGGPQAVGGASVGAVWADAGVGAHLEAVGAYGLASSGGSAVPVEVSATVRGAHGPGWWAAGVGTGLTEGVGSSALRLFAGGGVRWGYSEPVPVPEVTEVAPEPVAPVVAVAASPVSVVVHDVRGATIPATVAFAGQSGSVEGRLDGDVVRASLQPGTWTMTVASDGFGSQTRTFDVGAGPVEVEAILLEQTGEGALTLSVANAEGGAAPGARVLIDGLPVGDVGSAQLVVGGLSAGEHEVSVRGHGFVGWKGFVAAPGAADVLLYPVEGTLRVVVSDADGAPVPDAFVAFDGPVRRPAVPLEGARQRVFVLSPGRWTALVSSERLGIQSRVVVLEEDAWTTAEARFVLGAGENGPADLRVRVVDVDGEPVEGARVRWQDAALGQTASGGDLQVGGLGLGAGDLAVEVDGALPIATEELVLQPGGQEHWVTVQWKPGTLWLRVRHPDGPVGDAVVLASGPASRPPLPLGPTGTATWQLAPGTWELLVTSAQWGTASRRVELPEAGGSRARVDVVLMPVGNVAGSATLALSVVDPDGGSVLGAAVRADSLPLGRTTSGGLTAPLSPGQRTLEVAADGFGDWEREVVLKVGPNAQRAELAWRSMVRLAVVGPDGAPASDATVRLVGPRTTAPVPVDDAGRRAIPAEPGRWQALAVSASHGIATADLEVPSGAKAVDHTLTIGASEPQVVLEVRDGLGRPVAEATADCAGCESVPGGAGLVGLRGLAGPTDVDVSAPHHRPTTVAVDPAASRVRLAVLDAVPVPIRVSVAGPAGEPVPATIRFSGPAAVAPTLTGPDGTEQIAVIPGAWAVTAEAEGFGVRRRDVLIEPGAEILRVDFSLAEARVSVADGRVRLDERVPFDLGSAVLRDGSDAVLREVADTLVAHPELALVEIGGHTDATGDLAFNQQLSEDRAAAVREALVRLGVAPSRLVARGYGPTRPLDESGTEDAHQRNRRVQFAVLETAVQ